MSSRRDFLLSGLPAKTDRFYELIGLPAKEARFFELIRLPDLCDGASQESPASWYRRMWNFFISSLIMRETNNRTGMFLNGLRAKKTHESGLERNQRDR